MSNEDRNNLNNVHDENSCQTKEISPSYNSIDQITKDGYKILMEAIRNANALPSRRDWDFYGTHESFNTIITTESNKILKQINSILRSNDIEGNIRNRILEEKTELMIEANDMILEKAANNIDEMNGIRKTVVEPVVIQTVCAQLPVNGSWNRVNNATFSVSSSITSESSQKSANAIRLLTAKNIVRPQKFFKDKIINSSKYPWEPRIKEKPNSLKPLALFIEETQNGEEYTHPYEFELERFTPPADQLKKVIPAIPLKIEDTPLIEVNEPAQIEELIEVLRNCKEFAVDLEHHSYRSFMGITCLMQISTRKQDYLIDTLALRDKLYMLNEVFTKPSIVKIFHGADMDIQWLQKDLSLYVVNMFDTYHAAKQLGYTGLSLAFLMQKFCNFMPNKQFQLADWRIRPLPDELKTYAREDTHYLIYIYDMMKNELIDKANGQTNLLLSALNNSTETCKKRYFRPVLREDSHLDFYRKCKRLFDNRQLYALKELYKWRDQLSREQDESTGYVLPNHMLLQISETLPREMQGILACCNPIPPLVRSNLLEIHQIVLRAKEQSLEKGYNKKMSKINVDSPLHCPHDLTKSGEFRDDLPTVMGKSTAENLRDITNVKLEIENDISVYTLFNEADDIDNKEKSENNLHSFTFLSPFERYKLVKPFIQAEEERLAIEKAEEEEKAKSDNNDPNNISRKDTRTDEERIESIREHFLSLAKKTGPATVDTDGEQNLIQMGGTKRKRAPSPQEQEYSSQETDLQTTVPNLNKGTFNPRKRKSTDMNNGSPSKVTKSKDAPLSAEKRKFNKKKMERAKEIE
ncbi:hypothetical protein NQ318_011055 [Aromia moschata]|uniref:Exosome complex component 10 homolog n=1 Tax=Aromia moschata TaxID=1265417 RepID=A0AAV8YSK1_9CUCU|nr:hypothetical protein NQ318_011055 [Aromia moschata]